MLHSLKREQVLNGLKEDTSAEQPKERTNAEQMMIKLMMRMMMMLMIAVHNVLAHASQKLIIEEQISNRALCAVTRPLLVLYSRL